MLVEALGGQKVMGMWAIEAIQLKFDVIFDLRGHLEAAMTSEVEWRNGISKHFSICQT